MQSRHQLDGNPRGIGIARSQGGGQRTFDRSGVAAQVAVGAAPGLKRWCHLARASLGTAATGLAND